MGNTLILPDTFLSTCWWIFYSWSWWSMPWGSSGLLSCLALLCC